MSEEKISKSDVNSFMEDGMIMSLMENVIPKVIPMLNPTLSKFTEYLGDDKRTIVIRRKKDKPPLILIFNNKKNFQVNGEGVTGDSDAIEKVFNVKQFVEELINGNLKI